MKSYCLIIFKPDALERQLVGPILKDFLDHGFTIEIADCKTVTRPLIFAHYEEVITRLGEAFKKRAAAYFTGKRMIPVIVSQAGDQAIPNARKLVGKTDPSVAAPESIRGHYGRDSLAAADAQGRIAENLIHCCDSQEAFDRETALWFDPAVFDPNGIEA
ncbi:MAG: nucleoside-diphosphate kinase [Eubacteriaceae bacterium]|nr:nucleoside-diphosphate kinase [Eubacteriaceae bacterium]MDD4507672.1 nucleoside-diphosphate kinase [Eubacteriaceae bacterium]